MGSRSHYYRMTPHRCGLSPSGVGVGLYRERIFASVARSFPMRFDVRFCAVALFVLASACSDSAPGNVETPGAGGSGPGGGDSGPASATGITTGGSNQG